MAKRTLTRNALRKSPHDAPSNAERALDFLRHQEPLFLARVRDPQQEAVVELPLGRVFPRWCELSGRVLRLHTDEILGARLGRMLRAPRRRSMRSDTVRRSGRRTCPPAREHECREDEQSASPVIARG